MIVHTENMNIAQIDRLSSLPDELLLIVFERLRSASYKQSIKPLSRSLQPFQRINLYHTIRIRNCATLVKFYHSIKSETTGLGKLVQNIHIDIAEPTVKRFHQENENILAGIRDLVPNLRVIDCEQSVTLGDIFLDQIRGFEDLEWLELSTTSSKYIDLLELEKLKGVGLEILGDDSDAENCTEIVSHLRQLSLDTFNIYAPTPSPFLVRFFQSIKAKDVTLSIRRGVDVIPRALAALNPGTTSHMTLDNAFDSPPYILDSPPFILDSHLNRFTLLRHLSLGSGMSANKSFFTAILATPLISLCLDPGFDLDAQSLNDALKGPTRSEQLKTLRLDNIEVGEDEIFGGYDGVRRWPGCWTATCKMKQIVELRTIAKTGGFKLTGTTVEAAVYCEEIIETRDEDEGSGYEDEYLER